MLYTVPYGTSRGELALDGEGNAIILGQTSSNGKTQYVYMTFDHEAKSISQKYELPSDAMSTISFAPGYDAYWYSGAGIIGGNVDEKPETLVTWSDYDIKYSQVDAIKIVDENHIFFMLEGTDEEFPKIGLFTTEDIEGYEAARVTKKRETITLAYVASSDVSAPKYIESCIASFNDTNQKYRIKTVYYATDGTLSANNTLVRDIVSGNIPDMILFDEDISADAFADLDIFIDLYKLMDADETYNRDAFVPCVLTPFENNDGELPYLTMQFGLSTVISSKKTMGNMESWTLKQMADYTKSLGDRTLFSYYTIQKEYTPSNLLEQLLPDMLGNYIDYEKGKADFGGDLKTLLEMCKSANVYNQATATPPLYVSGDVSVKFQTNITNISRFLVTKYGFYGGEDVTYIGYPTDSGCGTSIIPTMSLAITTACKKPTGAWEFITHCLDDMYAEWEYTAPVEDEGSEYVEYPEISTTNAFSCEKRTIERMLDTLEHYYFYTFTSISDYDNNYVIQGTTSSPRHYTLDGGYQERDLKPNKLYNSIEFYSLSEEDRNDFMGLLDNITMVRSYDSDLLAIIYEDAQYYFNGTKSLDETVKIIEKRVKTKLSE
ncbi:MAG: hypothetical protein IJ493_09965 [Clostridia bacterium]|nr:hypothetical protein [Clostridia bacterium]